MDYYVLDFETFYDSKNKYSLRGMTTEEYINDPRFKSFGFSVSKNGGPAHWVSEERAEFMLRQLKLHEHAVIAHNAQFDMAILNWKYGVRPKFIVDTLAMARGVLGNEERLSLEMLGERYGIGTKGDEVVHMDGVRDPAPAQLKRLGEYAKNDATMTWGLWCILKEGFPLKELMIIDITTRMFTEPSFVIDRTPVLRELEIGAARKEELLSRANCTMEDLRSDAKFAAMLESLGVEPPKKLSIKKSAAAKLKDPDASPVYAWAFAKNDVDFKALAAHENELVQWAVEARLGLKSTIKQSRAERFLGIAVRMGKLPVSLIYYGAGTGRYSAGGSINCQNLPAVRGSADPDAGLLRKSLVAPPGKVVVVSDAAQIEARILAWLAGQHDVVEAFAQGRDVYSEMASVIFGRHVDRKKNKDDYIPGFIGKSVVLGAGYGLGHQKFASMIYVGMLGGPSVLFDDAMVDTLGVNVESYSRYIWKKEDLLGKLVESKPAGVDVETWVKHSACAQKIINTFRESSDAVPRFWATCERMLGAMYRGTGEKISIFETGKNFLVLPNGMKLHFKELEHDRKDGYSCLRKKEGRVKRVKLYGGGVAENCIAGDALVLTDTGWKPIKSVGGEDKVHDGVDFVPHGGIVSKSVQRCVEIDGVYMTPNHEVLTDEGWKFALEEPRPYRPHIRATDRLAYIAQRREEDVLGVPLRVWESDHKGGGGRNEGRKAGRDPKLRVQNPGTPTKGQHDPRDEQTPGFRSVEEHVRPLSFTDTSSVEKLWRAGYKSLRQMAGEIRALLDRHGKHISAWADTGQGRQLGGVLAEKLSVGALQSTGKQYAQKPDYKHSHGRDDCATSVRDIRHRTHNHLIQDCKRMSARKNPGEAGLRKPVYDIINAGPLNRFVVLGACGPFIVHNCTQSLAGAYVKEAMVRMRLKGHRPILQVHDEVVCLADEADAEKALREVNECMETVPDWAVGLPLAAEGSFAGSYGEAK